MQNFVISLTTAHDRREHINNEFGKHNVPFDFFDALTPDIAVPYANKLGIDLGSNLTPTETACMMSHIAVWERAINEGLPYVGIFEDDIFLGEDAQTLLNSEDWIQSNWHIIKLEAFSKRAYLSTKSVEVLPNKRHIHLLEGKNLGAAGYIVSLKGAKLLLDFVATHQAQPVDKIIFDQFIHDMPGFVYQMLPALCEQEKILKAKKNDSNVILPSSLTAERKKRRLTEKKKGLSKVALETTRIFKQAKKALLAKDIEFK